MLVLYDVVQHVWYEVLGPNARGEDAALWVASALDFILWVGLFFVVLHTFWPAPRTER